MPLEINAKSSGGPNAIRYNGWQPHDFDTVTLASSQANTTVAALMPLLVATKIIGLAAVMTTVNGAAPVSINIVSGIGAETTLGPIDPGIYPPTAAQMAQNGNMLFAADQPLNGASAPVAGTVYPLYPVSDAWDIIWPPMSLITLRVATGAAAAGSVLKVVVYAIPIDIHPSMPNGANIFAPSAAIL